MQSDQFLFTVKTQTIGAGKLLENLAEKAGTTKLDLSGLSQVAYVSSFEFTQAIRWLEWQIETLAKTQGAKTISIGTHGSFRDETLAFCTDTSFSFPPSPIGRVDKIKNASGDKLALKIKFLSFFGADGALPTHYSELVNARLSEKDSGFYDFLTLFQHRFISLYFRGLIKADFLLSYERAKRNSDFKRSQSERALRGIAGYDDAKVNAILTYYASFFRMKTRSAAALEELIADLIQKKVEIIQCMGGWHVLAEDQRTQIKKRGTLQNPQKRLGQDALLGTRVWSPTSGVQIKVCGLSDEDFERFHPSGPYLALIRKVAKTFAGPQLHIDFLLEIDMESTRMIGRKHPLPKCHLGWTARLVRFPKSQKLETHHVLAFDHSRYHQ